MNIMRNQLTPTHLICPDDALNCQVIVNNFVGNGSLGDHVGGGEGWGEGGQWHVVGLGLSQRRGSSVGLTWPCTSSRISEKCVP